MRKRETRFRKSLSCGGSPLGAALAIVLVAALATGALAAIDKPNVLTDQGPIWVCFDADDPPSPEMYQAIEEAMAEYFNLAGRWPGSQGDPIALTWSFMPDGVMIGQSGFDEPAQGALPSNLFATLDGQFPSRAAWVSRFQQCFDRWEQLTGVNFTRVTTGGNDWDDGAAAGTAGDGVNRGDIRIGGRCIDGAGGVDCTGGTPTPGNTLAYNQFPGNGGDQVIDTAENWFQGGTELFLRNTVMHEVGHGIGLFHVCPSNQTKLMEPFISQAYDGPQHDDIRGSQVHYGDPFEADNGSGSATNLGVLTDTSPINLGDFPAPAVVFGSIHSIDANGESDFFRFTINASELLDMSVAPIGLNYDSSTQAGDGTCNSGNFVNSLTMADLAVEVIDVDGTTVLTTVDGQGAGGTEVLDGFLLPAAGTYFLRIFEVNSPPESQLYSLSMDVNDPPVAVCSNFGVSADAACCATVSVSDIDGGSSDPDGPADIASLCITQVDGVPVGCQASVQVCGDGMHSARLTITDLAGETSSCTATITIIDDTDPTITCPADITVECSASGGTPADDPQLIPFFTGVSALDNCDASPTIDDDAPDFFPLGPTLVTFTAMDDAGNQTSCTAAVTVVDMTPPTIDVTLDRDTLWPPNHRLATITATVVVTDICDPNPTYVLTSITSDEPDNGQGDGDTENDIQDADYGTADDVFRLRSERQGGGDGRTYTIIYTATDASGNTASDTVYVNVPHDQSGAAVVAIGGFTADGTAFQPAAKTFVIAIFSTAVMDAETIVPERVVVGNHLAQIEAAEYVLQDLNTDGQVDLSIRYEVDATVAVMNMQDEGQTYAVGMRYETDSAAGYLVSDILALGPPGVPQLTGVEPAASEREPYRIEPNPFTQTTRMAYAVVGGAAQAVEIVVYNVAGQRLRTLVSGVRSPGQYEAVWDGRDDRGSSAPTGVYFLQARVGAEEVVRRVSLVR